MAMSHELSRLIATRRKPKAENHVIEAGLEGDEQVFTRDSTLARCAHEEVPELLLLKAIHPLHLLLLAKLDGIVGLLPSPGLGRAMLPRRVGAALDRALLGVALLPLQEQLLPLAAAELAD
jgi:hypothetical protein